MRRNTIFTLAGGALILVMNHLGAQSAGAPYGAYSQSPDERQPAGERVQTPAPSLNFRASAILGMPVRNDAGERLGKVQDVVINLGSDTAPFAIIEHGGAMGVAETKVAVPLRDLRFEGNELKLSASKEQFDAASASPAGGWSAVAGQAWLKDVDRFYGQPSLTGQAQFERQESAINGGREPVRTPAGPAGSSMQYPTTGPSGQTVNTMSRPEDQQLAAQVNALVQQNAQNGSRNIQVVIRNGVVTLRGRIPTEEQRDLLEKQIKALPGVDRVQDSMITGPE
jgi:osmotically-inducible protein OsmY/sporulation protein YlmC with PRC-barrel domain